MIDFDALEARALRNLFYRQGGFKHFVRHFWPCVDPRKLIWGWHLDIMCDVIEAMMRGWVPRVLINIPPGYAKSIICSVLGPCWKWGEDPTWGYISGSHDENLALRDSVKARDLIKHPEYQRVYQPEWKFNPAQDTKHLYRNTAGGMRYSTSVGGAITGFRGSAVIVDDPLDANKAPSEVKLREHIEWFGNLASRIDDMEHSQWLVIMQRLCEGDLSDYLTQIGGWMHLRLPAEYDPETPCQIKNEDGEVLWEDPRTEKGEPLFPAYQPIKTLQRLRVYLGDERFESQYNQVPVPPGGAIVKHDQVRWYSHAPAFVRKKCTQVVISADLTFMKSDAGQEKVNSRRSFNNLDVWGTDGRNFYLLDNANGRWKWAECKDILKDLVRRWGVWTVLVEEATVSGVVKQEMDHVIHEIIEIPPRGSKEARFQVAALYWRLNRVWLPDAQWAHEYFQYIMKFPGTIHKDRADTMSQALNFYTADGGFDPDEQSSGSLYSKKDIEIKPFNPAGAMLLNGRVQHWGR